MNTLFPKERPCSSHFIWSIGTRRSGDRMPINSTLTISLWIRLRNDIRLLICRFQWAKEIAWVRSIHLNMDDTCHSFNLQVINTQCCQWRCWLRSFYWTTNFQRILNSMSLDFARKFPWNCALRMELNWQRDEVLSKKKIRNLNCI